MSAVQSAQESHARLMDRMYRYQRYIYDFTRKYYLFGRDTLIRDLNPRRVRPCSKSAAAPAATSP